MRRDDNDLIGVGNDILRHVILLREKKEGEREWGGENLHITITNFVLFSIFSFTTKKHVEKTHNIVKLHTEGLISVRCYVL